MKKLVVYYSRTGTTKIAAEILAKELNADIEGIVDKTKRSGIFGFIKSGRDAMKRRMTEIEPVKQNANSYDLIVIGTPVWAGNIPPAIRTYLTKNSLEKKKVAILITCSGSEVGKIVEEIKNSIQKAEVIGELAIKRREISDAESKIKEWVKNLKLQQSSR